VKKEPKDHKKKVVDCDFRQSKFFNGIDIDFFPVGKMEKI